MYKEIWNVEKSLLLPQLTCLRAKPSSFDQSWESSQNDGVVPFRLSPTDRSNRTHPIKKSQLDLWPLPTVTSAPHANSNFLVSTMSFYRQTVSLSSTLNVWSMTILHRMLCLWLHLPSNAKHHPCTQRKVLRVIVTNLIVPYSRVISTT